VCRHARLLFRIGRLVGGWARNEELGAARLPSFRVSRELAALAEVTASLLLVTELEANLGACAPRLLEILAIRTVDRERAREALLGVREVTLLLVGDAKVIIADAELRLRTALRNDAMPSSMRPS